MGHQLYHHTRYHFSTLGGRECRNKRIYAPRIESWWECPGDGWECLDRLQMELEQVREMCPHACHVKHRMGTMFQVQMLRTRYLHYMIPRGTRKQSRGACIPRWTRTMEIVANSIRQRALERCQIDSDLLRYLERKVHQECPRAASTVMNHGMDAFTRARVWRRRHAMHRVPVLEGSRYERQMLGLSRRYPGMVPEARIVPQLPLSMVQAANGDMKRLGWIGSRGTLDSPSTYSGSSSNANMMMPGSGMMPGSNMTPGSNSLMPPSNMMSGSSGANMMPGASMMSSGSNILSPRSSMMSSSNMIPGSSMMPRSNMPPGPSMMSGSSGSNIMSSGMSSGSNMPLGGSMMGPNMLPGSSLASGSNIMSSSNITPRSNVPPGSNMMMSPGSNMMSGSNISPNSYMGSNNKMMPPMRSANSMFSGANPMMSRFLMTGANMRPNVMNQRMPPITGYNQNPNMPIQQQQANTVHHHISSQSSTQPNIQSLLLSLSRGLGVQQAAPGTNQQIVSSGACKLSPQHARSLEDQIRKIDRDVAALQILDANSPQFAQQKQLRNQLVGVLQSNNCPVPVIK